MIWRGLYALIRGLFVAGMLVALMPVHVPGVRFDAEAWRSYHGPSSPLRGLMADRFVAYGALMGATRIEILRVLGPTTDSDYMSEWDLVYWLGIQRSGMPIDSEWLCLRLGDDDRVVEAKILID